eukprot:359823_1
MPVVGIGTGPYQSGKSNISHPEHWNYTIAFQVSTSWFSINGSRWDSSVDYIAVNGTADGLLTATKHWTETPRDTFFITSKTGPAINLLGYNESIEQWKQIVKVWNTTYVDLLLIHFPYKNPSNSTDPYCNTSNSKYSVKLCIQSTWKAYEYIFNELKGAKAIGVSNFEQEHINYILELNSLIPSVNQFEFHGYYHEYDLVNFCQSLNITVNGYAPLGTPDVEYGNWIPPTPILTEHPVAINISKKYNKTAAQIWLKWQLQQNIVINPRSWNITHMKQNIDIFDFEINQEDMLNLASVSVPKDPKVCGVVS